MAPYRLQSPLKILSEIEGVRTKRRSFISLDDTLLVAKFTQFSMIVDLQKACHLQGIGRSGRSEASGRRKRYPGGKL